MSLACYCSRHRSVYLTLKLTKREQWKSLKEVQDRRNIFRNRSNLLYCSTRSVSGNGPSSQTPKSEASKEPKDKPTESKESITKFLQNYKPANEQTEKILKMLKETSNQLREKAMIYYNEKRDYLTKGKMLTEGEEEHWYSARVNFMMKRYEDFVGLTDVKNAQVRVQKTEKLFVKSQDDRRETQRLINEVQAKIKNLHTELERTHRGEDKYLELVTLEHTVLREERTYIEQLSLQERNEREAFSRLSRAVRDSHESERAQAEKTKYWAVLGSIIGTSLGVLGTTINNRLRMRELRQIVRDASAGNSQNAAATATVSAAALNTTVSKDLINQNTESLKSEIVEEVQNKFEEYSKKVENVGKSTNDKMNEITKSISKLSDNVGEQKHKSIEVLSLLERRPFTNTKSDVHLESLNKKAVVELQQALETQIMRWEEKVDNIMKLHLENSSNTKSLNALERKVTEVLAFEKYMVEKTAKLYDDYNRNSAIGKYNSL